MVETLKVSIHAPAWGATGGPYQRPVAGRVSIHAPAWGATKRRWPVPRARSCFNPRARVGRDAWWLVRQRPLSRFQSTRPRGARQRHVGDAGSLDVVSIHAPAWGATRLQRRRSALRDVSIHAPAWGATTISTPASRRGTVSIHAPAWGATIQVIPRP